MSDLEKASVQEAGSNDSHDHDIRGFYNLPPDPDAHLSPEERAKIVCVLLTQYNLQLHS